LDELVFTDDPVGILGKVQQQIEDLRLNMNYTLSASDLPPVYINPEVIELEQQVRSSSLAVLKRITGASGAKSKLV
jgi:hypothetical protein